MLCIMGSGTRDTSRNGVDLNFVLFVSGKTSRPSKTTNIRDGLCPRGTRKHFF